MRILAFVFFTQDKIVKIRLTNTQLNVKDTYLLIFNVLINTKKAPFRGFRIAIKILIKTYNVRNRFR